MEVTEKVGPRKWIAVACAIPAFLVFIYCMYGVVAVVINFINQALKSCCGF